MTTQTFERARVTCTLAFSSDVRVGSGETFPEDAPESALEEHLRIPFCLDCNNLPMIPSTTVRGALAARYDLLCASESIIAEPENRNEIFGFADTLQDGDAPGQMGALRVFDSRMVGSDPVYYKRTRIKMDPALRVAEAHKLFTDIALVKGVRFELNMELHQVREDDLRNLLTTLNSFAGRPGDQIGANKSLGRGMFKASDIHCSVLSLESLRLWLSDESELHTHFTRFKIDSRRIDPPSRFVDIGVRLAPLAPILIVDHEACTDDQSKHQNVIRYLRHGDDLVIPASTIKGILRHHCRRILLTKMQQGSMVSDLDRGVAEIMLGVVFGNETGMSLLQFSDFSAHLVKEQAGEVVKYAEEHAQTLIAVDRFTGGVGAGKLFSTISAMPRQIDGEVSIARKLLNDLPAFAWALGLLAFAVRDWLADPIYLGWGKARGFGECRTTIVPAGADQINSWTRAVEYLGSKAGVAPEQLLEMAAALDSKITDLRQRLSEESS